LRLKAVPGQPRHTRGVLFTAHRIERHVFIARLRRTLKTRHAPLQDGFVEIG